jgi:hypothetical protein
MNALITLHQVHRFRLQRNHQMVGQQPFSQRSDAPFDCPSYYEFRENVLGPQQLE